MTGKNPLGNGKEPQSYEGLNVIVPVGGWQLVRAKRDPTTNDKKYPVGALWVNTSAENVWIQVQPAGVWLQVANSSGDLLISAPLTNNGVIYATGSQTATSTAAGAVGTVLAGNGSSSAPTFQAIPSLNVVDSTGTTQAMAVNTTYIADNAGLVTFTLPATAAQGSTMSIVGNGAGGWTIAQNASQVIKMNSSTTTSGTGGSMSSTNRYNSVTLLATVGGASTTWVVQNFSGTFTFV